MEKQQGKRRTLWLPYDLDSKAEVIRARPFIKTNDVFRGDEENGK